MFFFGLYDLESIRFIRIKLILTNVSFIFCYSNLVVSSKRQISGISLMKDPRYVSRHIRWCNQEFMWSLGSDEDFDCVVSKIMLLAVGDHNFKLKHQ